MSEARRWFADEWLVTESDLIGKTREEIGALAHARDLQHLQGQDEGPGPMPFFEC